MQVTQVQKLSTKKSKSLFTRYNLLLNRFDNRVNVNVCIHYTTGCQTGLTTGCIVYTNIQPVVNDNPFDKRLYSVYSRLPNRLYNRLNEQWLFVQHCCQTRLTTGCIVCMNIQPIDNRLHVCLHDTTGCQTSCTTSCIM